MTMTVGQALAILAGLLFAEVISRWIATARPADTDKTAARFPWYGRDAGAAQHRRPGHFQLLAPVVMWGMLSIFMPRSWSELSTAFALGTLLALMRSVALWHLAPLVFRVKDSTAQSWSNRLFPLEQPEVQDQIAGYFQHWDQVESLAAAQRGAVCGPLETRIVVSAEALAQTAQSCRYQVQEGDDLDEWLQATGVKREEVVELNFGKLQWKPGNLVTLPRALCLHIIEVKEKDQDHG